MTQEEYYLQHSNCPNCLDDNLTITDKLIKFTGKNDFMDDNKVRCDCGWRGIVHDLVPDAPTNVPYDLSKLTKGDLQSLALQIDNEIKNYVNREKVEVYFFKIDFNSIRYFQTFENLSQYLRIFTESNTFNKDIRTASYGLTHIDNALYNELFGV